MSSRSILATHFQPEFYKKSISIITDFQEKDYQKFKNKIKNHKLKIRKIQNKRNKNRKEKQAK